jgi:thiol-disulfide isomerase/thioredoxin
MKIKWMALSGMIILALLLAACSPAVEPTQAMEDKPAVETTMEDTAPVQDDMKSDTPAEVMASEEEKDEMEQPAVDDEMNEEDMMDAPSSDAAMDMPDWFKTELVNVSTGETFRIADFQGKVVLVETMAMWCSNCLKQQQQVKALHELLGERDDFVSVGLDIDINEDAATLAKYVERNSFDWIYTIVPAEVGRDLGNLYGNQFLNPPSTPMLIIDAKGEVHPLPFGIKSAEKLLEALEPFLTDSM